ncbi:aggregation-promoting factor [Fructilactobacillus fructivorans]|uniref:LysM peptidoglycan-binding domain-containing protein n=1 Tax=Fructilactobacillus fructivorans TaxID=1614 RepID=A0AAE6TYW8_9LACO|nr:LysM peptidoglycan-binding domain-containing protein [Fructilactobacillus fructivorans]KRK57520.1 peptidoglycan binding protein [Fructilactobacillus fructivorans]QFX93195.1 LysM peptidoglycan-binding domain-containing protein [Fructilactobacillus fructivorans]RDV64811.1 LysM domain-containing protein [Fructilactobacillus fructivorans]
MKSKSIKAVVLSSAAALGLLAVGANTTHASTNVTVKSGDTISEIAQQYKVSANEIAKVNHLQNADQITVGQRLVIPTGVTVPNAVSQSAQTTNTQAPKTTTKAVQAPAAKVQAPAQQQVAAQPAQEAQVQAPAAKAQTPVKQQAAAQPAPKANVQQNTQLAAQNNNNAQPQQKVQAPVKQQAAAQPAPKANVQTNTVNSVQSNSNSQPTNQRSYAVQTNTVKPTQNVNYQSSNTSSNGGDDAAKAWITSRESGGSYTASNGNYYGKYQLSKSYLNGDYSQANQDRVANQYVTSRYGSWSGAQSFWQSHGWY